MNLEGMAIMIAIIAVIVIMTSRIIWKERKLLPLYIAIFISIVQLVLSLYAKGVAGLSGSTAAFISILSLLVSITTAENIERKTMLAIGLILFNAVSFLIPYTNDIIRLFIYWKTLSFVILGSLNMRHTEDEYEASIKYIVICVIAVLVALVGIFMAIHDAQSTKITDIIHKSSFIAKVLIVAGLAAEAAMFPMYFWLPDVHMTMLPLLAVLLMGAATPSTTYVVGHIASTNIFTKEIVGILAVVTSIIAALAATFQKNIKRLLAYSTLSHFGYMLFAFTTGVPLGVQYGALHILAHATVKIPAFLVAYLMIEYVGMYSVSGLRELDVDIIRFIVITSAIGLLGLPPLLTFWSEVFIFIASYSLGGIWKLLALAFFMAILFSTGYAFKLIYSFSKRNDKKDVKLNRKIVIASLPLAIAVVLSIIFGIFQSNIIIYFFH
ncbi:NADH/Ubiquinone/plastoquinone (complex I) [Methanothermus fervidus DSM 2088]|uniref:NADH/Ubiquinone/plastoquinone (Complex I) n=1 Tax=Methanothermus fervidus (strain ATCC 43054 / DSM 2088 / JCM 10308 / V24 S) TaxID=523846 RepID=E3GYQ0_METFV|nr:proton-conducting transporter membrane subunit [Methanothermus fervidus]ADP77432.1 NADH/Ubiquinone/plastoquinone (complex I) [Methanothermus fervidus DSM 2088]